MGSFDTNLPMFFLFIYASVYNIRTDTPTDTEKEFEASCIDKGKVLFYLGSDLRKLCKPLDYTLYKYHL